MHTHFCKYILGLSEKSSNLASRIELGRTPMELVIKTKIIKYWQRLALLPNNHILKRVYLENIELDNKLSKNVWASCPRVTLESNGWGIGWYNNPNYVNISNFKNCLLNQLQQRVHEALYNDQVKFGTGNKLRTYREFKDGINCESYLSDVSNFKHRKAFTKLRTSDHKLQIEVGRHNKTPLNERFCKFCPSEIEDEKHFLMECTLYSDMRNELYNDINKDIIYFKNMNKDSQLRILLQPHARVAVLVTRFVYGASCRRKDSID